MAEQQQRWEAVCKSGFSGRVNWWGAEGWREEVRGAVGGWEGWGVWVFGWGGGGSDLEGGGVMGGWIGET